MNIIINFLPFTILFMVIDKISSFNFISGNYYYYYLGFVFLVILIFSKNVKFNFLMFLVVWAAALSIVINDIPEFFRPYERLVAFIFVILLISPFVRSNKLDSVRLKIFSLLNISIIAMSVLSIISLLSGLYAWDDGRSDFSGYFTHSMVLGPMAGIAIINSLHIARTVDDKKYRVLFHVTAILSFLACVASGSRIGLLASLMGVLFFIYKINQGKFTRTLKVFFLFAALIVFTFPLWKGLTENMMNKFLYGQERANIAASRTYIWEDRVSEFKSSPLIGIGFSSVDIDISTNFELEGGKVEPGSSWLAVLSMTGLLGAIPIFLIFVKYFIFSFAPVEDINNIAKMGGLLILFIVHMIAEGYIYSAGSGMFFYLWLLIGVIDISKCDYDINIRQYRINSFRVKFHL